MHLTIHKLGVPLDIHSLLKTKIIPELVKIYCCIQKQPLPSSAKAEVRCERGGKKGLRVAGVLPQLLFVCFLH